MQGFSSHLLLIRHPPPRPPPHPAQRCLALDIPVHPIYSMPQFHLQLIGNLESLCVIYFYISFVPLLPPASAVSSVISIRVAASKLTRPKPVLKRNESVTCETERALYIGSSACNRAAERPEALLEQMTSGLCFIHHYQRANLTLPFKCTGLKAHTHTYTHTGIHTSSSSSFLLPPRLFLTNTHTHAWTEWRGGCHERVPVWGLVVVHLD